MAIIVDRSHENLVEPARMGAEAIPPRHSRDAARGRAEEDRRNKGPRLSITSEKVEGRGGTLWISDSGNHRIVKDRFAVE